MLKGFSERTCQAPSHSCLESYAQYLVAIVIQHYEIWLLSFTLDGASRKERESKVIKREEFPKRPQFNLITNFSDELKVSSTDYL